MSVDNAFDQVAAQFPQAEYMRMDMADMITGVTLILSHEPQTIPEIIAYKHGQPTDSYTTTAASDPSASVQVEAFVKQALGL